MSRVDGVIRMFLGDEGGAVAIDWVALTSGILLLGVMVVYSIFDGGVANLTGWINETLADASAVDSATDGGGRTGNAADQACITTGKFTVCMGPK